jgi:uncharacterized membrane protein YphA (DoxX/SURF4 family)
MSDDGAAVDAGLRSSFLERARGLARRGPAPMAVARVGLGAMLLTAGVHKLLAPAVWATYAVDWLAPLLVVSPRTFMLLNGPAELVVGAALVADRWTAPAAAIAAVSLTATAGYLAVVLLTQGLFGDVLARDVGLAALAWTVMLDRLRRPG